MNIVLFSPSWPQNDNANGIVTYCANMYSALKRQGHNVYILCGHTEIKNDPTVYTVDYSISPFEKLWCLFGDRLSEGYRNYYLGAKAILAGIRQIESEHAIDIMEIEESFGWHYFLQKQVDFPIALRLHGPHYVNGTMGDRQLETVDYNRFKREKRCFEAAKYVNAPCRWMLNSPQEKYSLKWPLQSVFFNPIDVLEEQECWSPDSYVKNQILFVGRFDAHKGGDLVIKAFARVLQDIPDASLVFAGPDKGVKLATGETIHLDAMVDGVLSEEGKQRFTYLGLVDKDTIKTLRRSSHITVMASRNENFPYSVIESLASAAPIIAAKVGGVPEVFIDQKSGVFFEGSDVEDLADKIVSLLGDAELVNTLSKEAYLRGKDSFNSDMLATEACKFYQQAIAMHKKAS